MRGKAAQAIRYARRPRITPAHAGKSCHPVSAAPLCKDHPRPCGEKRTRSTRSCWPTGSPPPMRGKVRAPVAIMFDPGITPAHAGKSQPCRRHAACRRGSPPPMRGKAGRMSQAPSESGITPAHAGKSSFSAFSPGQGRDHPRPCGEKSTAITAGAPQQGSPPPMRGKDGIVPAQKLHTGITPAHAGKRACAHARARRARDHPRPCGEKIIAPVDASAVVGSPPPMRGKDQHDLHAARSGGITPAHAGKSPSLASLHPRYRDHPRPCGEKQEYSQGNGWYQGSPPPMRGKA